MLPTAAVHVEVSDGWFQRVTLTNPDGKVVAGTLNRDRTAFTTTEPVGYGALYTWGGSVVGQDGKATPVTGTFSTIKPNVVVNSQFQLSDGQTVGVAAPIILQFDAPISDKAAVEKALSVTTNPPVQGSWAWLPDESEGSRVHWRTREYYPAGTTVHVEAKLYGVGFGDDNYGATDSTLDFDIGRRQVVKADAGSHRIQVITDNGVLFDFPCSYGEGDRTAQRHPQRHPRGQREVRETSTCPTRRLRLHRRPRTVGGADQQQRRVHPRQPGQSPARRATTNVTHGCINLSTDRRQGSTSTPRSTATRSRSPAPRSQLVLRRRRHLGLGAVLGHLGVDVGATAGERGPGADVDPEHGAGDAHRRADAVGHSDADDDLQYRPGDRY